MHHSQTLEWWAVLPFLAMLLSIAILPLFHKTAHWWERNRSKLMLAAMLGLPAAVWMCVVGYGDNVMHAVVEYTQFIILLFSLYVISGNICVRGDIRATPENNVMFLGFGAVIASFIGTTGAAMLLIRVILNTNREREHVVHTVVFAILIVANCGGLLTPLGDPPLFLGMLRGVPFFWTMNLWPHWLMVNGLLLLSYYALECRKYSQEKERSLKRDDAEIEPIRVLGKLHALWLMGVVACVAFLPSVDFHPHDGSAPFYWPLREMAMLGAAGLCYLTRNQEALRRNRFGFHPIAEVAALFVGIFLTMVPALLVLNHVAADLPLNAVALFVFTGTLSAFLDNAPTYVVFFEMARQLGGSPAVAGVATNYLIAISTGAVFCGAFTYIGNGPNFMVKAIAESENVKMPTFFGYMLWSFRYLFPTLAAMVLILIAASPLALLAGWCLVGGIVALSLWRILKYRFASAGLVQEPIALQPDPESAQV